MTEAIIAWQTLIFASIAFAGRWRGWVIALWVVWTLLQVFALPLSLLQFGTIAVAASMFRAKTPPEPSPLGQAESISATPGRAPVTSAASENAPAHARFAESMTALSRQADAWSVETQRRLDELRQGQQFREAAKQQIKTEGFSSALEERVMREALAHDQQLARELKQALGKDAVLSNLYHANLKGLRDQSQSVWERQQAEKAALRVSQTERRMLDRLTDEGPEFKRYYFEAKRLLLDLDAASNEAEVHLMLHGRHINDWIADVEALRASRNAAKHTAASSVEALFAPYVAAPQTAAPVVLDLPTGVPVEQASETGPAESTAYVTRNTFKRVGRGLQPAGVSIDAIYRYVYLKDLTSILNRGEATGLYVLRRMLEGDVSELGASERVFSPDYVFSVGQSKYHASRECEYLKASFSNYRVPPEIEAQGTDKVREFQQFCEANKQLLKDKSPAAFWAHVGTRFRISSHPRPVLYPNSGVQELALGMNVTELQQHIEAVADQAEDMIAQGANNGAIANLRYAPNPKRALETLDDPAVRAQVQKFFDLKRQLIDLLFEFYKRESGQDELELPIVLLETAGLAPCRGCAMPNPAQSRTMHTAERG